MSPTDTAQLVLFVHLLVVLFIVSGLIAIPLGSKLHWGFVSLFAYRAAHAGAMTIVVLQKLLGKLCFLSVWEFDLLRGAGQRETDMQPAFAFADRLIHWNMPLWFFTLLYALVWVYIIWLWRRFPPKLPKAIAPS
jgi:uncharacterized protein DUF2784